MAARDATVPGAKGDEPQPNQVANSQAGLFVIRFAIRRGVSGGRNDVLFGCPVPEIDLAAALTTERGFGIAEIDWLFADRTFHRTESNHRAGIWFGITNAGAAAMLIRFLNASGISVLASKVPMRS